MAAKILKKFLPNSWYTQLQKIHRTISNSNKYKKYDLSEDLSYNENLFKSLNFDVEKIKSKLNQVGRQSKLAITLLRGHRLIDPPIWG